MTHYTSITFASLAKGGYRDRIRNGVCAGRTKVASAASLPAPSISSGPALAKNAGQGTLEPNFRPPFERISDPHSGPARISSSKILPCVSSCSLFTPSALAGDSLVAHKLFWVVLRRCWARWKEPLIQVTPRTVVGWHRAGFRLYWKWLSRAKSRGGRKPVSKQIRALIFQMVAENPTWGAPRIHGDLLKLGFDLSEPTVSRWVRRAPRPPDPARRWLIFLRNHREV